MIYIIGFLVLVLLVNVAPNFIEVAVKGLIYTAIGASMLMLLFIARS